MSEIQELKSKEANEILGKKLSIGVWIVTVAVLGLVVLMRSVKIPLPEGFELGYLPPFHAFLNTMAALFLTAAIMAIKKGKASLHRRMINFAMFCSFLFLLSYVCYHFTTEETKYGGEGFGKHVYFFVLLTHIVLAALSFPFILLSYCYAFTNQFEKHKRMTRWVFPVWMYVAITGPLVYLLLRPYY